MPPPEPDGSFQQCVFFAYIYAPGELDNPLVSKRRIEVLRRLPAAVTVIVINSSVTLAQCLEPVEMIPRRLPSTKRSARRRVGGLCIIPGTLDSLLSPSSSPSLNIEPKVTLVLAILFFVLRQDNTNVDPRQQS